MKSLIDKNKKISKQRQEFVEHNFEAMVGARKRRYNDTQAQKQRTEFFEDYYLLYTRNKNKWQKLKEHISNQIIHYDELSDKFKKENNNCCVLLANSKRSMIDEILYKMQELEQELAELKEKAIVSRFKIEQRIWHLLCNNSSSCVVTEDVITNIEDGIYSLKKCRFCAIEEDLFATEQEAQEKLKEIQGNE